MSDPLSIAGSIAGLAQLTAMVFHTLMKYASDVKHAKSDVKQLATEIRILSGMFQNLSLLAASLEIIDGRDEQGEQAALDISQLQAWESTILKIKRTLSKAEEDFDGNSIKGRIRSLAWPFSKEDTLQLVDELSRHKATVNIALAADTLRKLVICLRHQEKLQMGLDKVQDSIELLQRIFGDASSSKETEAVRRFFLKANPQLQLQATQKLRAKDTFQWLLESPTFQAWLAASNSKVWLNGIPGSGKTIACGVIVEEVLKHASSDNAVAFFFCDYKRTQTQSLANIFSSIALQLGLQKHEAFIPLQKLYQELHSNNSLRRGPEDNELLDLLQTMSSLFIRTFVIVDAVDECRSDTTEVVRGLRDLANACANMSIVIVSRNEQEIRQILSSEYHEIEIKAHSSDLQIVLSDKILQERMSDLNLPESQRIRETLISQANGMFQWAVCQVDHLASLGPFARKRALDHLPSTLSKTYDRILHQLLSNRSNMFTRNIARRALHWICLCGDEISTAQLCEALSVSEDMDQPLSQSELIGPAEITLYCSSLIRRSSDGQKFELAHFSVKQYLEKIDPASELGMFHFSYAESSRLLAITSLRFLQLQEFRTTIERDRDFEERQRIKDRNNQHPFYPYAAIFWPSFPDCHSDSEVLTLIKTLFDKRQPLRNWVLQFLINKYEDEMNDKVFDTTVTFVTNVHTPLHIAAALCSPKLCEILLKRRSNPNIEGEIVCPLHCAFVGPESLVRHHDQVTYPHNTEASAASIGETIELFLKHGADTNKKLAGSSLSYWAVELSIVYKSALPILPFIRCGKMHIDVIPQLLRLANGHYRYDTSSFSRTIFQNILDLEVVATYDPELSQIVSCVQTNIVALQDWDTYEHFNTISLSASSIPDEDFKAHVKYAAENQRLEMISTLFADPRFKSHASKGDIKPLHIAIAQGNTEMMNLLFSSGADLMFQDEQGQTPLHICIKHSRIDMLRPLLREGDNNRKHIIRDRNGDSIWHLASRNNLTEYLKILFELDWDPLHIHAMHCQSKTGCTPLAEAVRNSSLEATELIREQCPTAEDYLSPDRSLMDLAIEAGCLHLVRSFARETKLVTGRRHDGSTVLFHLKHDIELDVLIYLVSIFDTSIQNSDGMVALESFLLRVALNEKKIDYWPPFDPTIVMLLLPKIENENYQPCLGSIWRLFCKKVVRWIQVRYDFGINMVLPILSALIEAGANMSYEAIQGHAGLVPLFEALLVIPKEVFKHDWVEILVEKMLDADSLFDRPLEDASSIRLLTRAIRCDQQTLIRIILERGVGMNLIGTGMDLALQEACDNASVATFRRVLDYCCISFSDFMQNHSSQLLAQLIKAGKFSKIDCTLEHGGDPNGANDSTPLIVLAAGLGKFSIVDRLWDKGGDIGVRNHSDNIDTAKLAAAAGDWMWLHRMHERLIANKIEYDWDSTATYTFKHSPNEGVISACNILHIAAGHNKLDVMEFLITKDLIKDLNVQTAEGYTPLHVSTMFNRIEAVKWLLEKGADVDIRDCRGKMALDIALGDLRVPLVKLLKSHLLLSAVVDDDTELAATAISMGVAV